MKKLLFTLLAALSVLSANAQKTDTVKNTVDTVGFSSVEQKPEFPGGLFMFYKYLKNRVYYPAVAHEDNIQGKVIMRAIIEKDGSLSNITTVQSPSNEFDKVIIRVLNAAPKWKPGLQGGQIVRVRFTISMTFKIDGNAGWLDIDWII